MEILLDGQKQKKAAYSGRTRIEICLSRRWDDLQRRIQGVGFGTWGNGHRFGGQEANWLDWVLSEGGMIAKVKLP